MMSSRNNKTFRDDKIALLYKTRDWADCIFLFEDQKIAAHKLILTCSSPVFELMFYGAMASAEIQISDIEAEDFKQMLEFLYTDSVTIASVTNAWSLLYISQKYFLNDLKKLCMDYINFNLTLSTLLLSYEYAELYNLRQLGEKCWRDILLSAKEVLQMDYHMQATTFCTLLDENEVNVSEKDLIETALKWSEEECVFQNIEDTKENKMKILVKAGIFSRLRFGCLGKSFYKYLCELLTSNSENISEYVSLINPIKEQRRKAPFPVRYKFRETYKIEQNVVLDDRIEFNCLITALNKIAVYGLAVTPPHQGGLLAHSDLMVTVYDKYGHVLCEAKDIAKVTSDYEYPHLVNFSEAIIFDACTPYRISVKYSTLACSSSCKPNELLCFHVSSHIKTHANSMTIYFNDEVCGGVVRGISYYVM